jgi:diguanylate cyclase (GGDEF)-like protein/PAS domain S-box-containing protein
MHNALPDGIFNALMNRLHDAVFVIKDGFFVYVNQRVVELLGHPESELLSRPVFDFVHEDDKELVKERYRARTQGKDVTGAYSFKIVNKEGKPRDVNIFTDIFEEADGTRFSIGSLKDITEDRKTQRALASTQADIESILNNLPDVFYRTDMDGIVTLISPSVYENLGYRPEEMIGKPLKDFYRAPEEREKIVQALVEGNGKARHVEAWLRHKDGSPIWISTNAYIRLDEHMQPVCVEGIARNITERKYLEEQLSHLAKFDELTRVYNRHTFLEESQRQIDIAQRYNRHLAMMMIDLDWFKIINDRYGHHIGDEALNYFATSCKAVFRKTDVIGRMGGEEFAVLMPETDKANANEIAERLRTYLKNNPLHTESGILKLTFSAGLISITKYDNSPDTMLRRADKLLYQAKDNGRDQLVGEA